MIELAQPYWRTRCERVEEMAAQMHEELRILRSQRDYWSNADVAKFRDEVRQLEFDLQESHRREDSKLAEANELRKLLKASRDRIDELQKMIANAKQATAEASRSIESASHYLIEVPF